MYFSFYLLGVGLTATTGQLADNHDLISLQTYSDSVVMEVDLPATHCYLYRIVLYCIVFFFIIMELFLFILDGRVSELYISAGC